MSLLDRYQFWLGLKEPSEDEALLLAAIPQAPMDFLKEAEQLQIEVDLVRGEDMQKVVAKVLATPKNPAARARAIIE